MPQLGAYLSLSVFLLSSTLAACEPSTVRGEGRSGGPRAAELSDCRAQAARQAEMRYPRPPRDGSVRPRFDDVVDRSDRAAAESRFYQQCVQQKQ